MTKFDTFTSKWVIATTECWFARLHSLLALPLHWHALWLVYKTRNHFLIQSEVKPQLTITQSRNFQSIVWPCVLKQFQTTQNIGSKKHFWQENHSLQITFNPFVSVNRLSNNPWDFPVHYHIDHVLCNSGEWLFWFWDFNNIESTHPFSFSSGFLLMFTEVFCLGIFFRFLVTDFDACWLALWSLWRFWTLFSPSCVKLIVAGFLK